MLNITNREKEIHLIDKIIKLDIDFKKNIFNTLKESYNGICNDYVNNFYVFKYQTQISYYNFLKFKIKCGYNSSIFKHFLVNYFNSIEKDNNQEQNMPFIIVSSPVFFNSLTFLCKLCNKIIGIRELWNKISSFL